MKDKKRELGSIIHEVIWQYCYGGGNTDSLFSYQDIDKAVDEIVELFFQPESELAQLKAEAEKEVSDEDIDRWIADQNYSEHNSVSKYVIGLRDGAKAHRDNLIKKVK